MLTAPRVLRTLDPAERDFWLLGHVANTLEGVESFGHAMAATPQNIAVSNAGIIDDAGDPPWVRRMTFVLSPSANQVAFVSVTTYRGELVVHVTTDEAKLPAALAEELVAGIGARLGARRVR